MGGLDLEILNVFELPSPSVFIIYEVIRQFGTSSCSAVLVLFHPCHNSIRARGTPPLLQPPHSS